MVGPVKRGGFYRPGVSNFMGTSICYLQAAFAIHWGNGVSLSVLLSTSRIFEFNDRTGKPRMIAHKYVCATTHTLSYVYFDCAVHICANHGVLSKSNDGDWRHRPAKMGSFGTMIDIPLCFRMVHSMPYKCVCATTHTLSYVYFDSAVHKCANHGVLSKSPILQPHFPGFLQMRLVDSK